MYTEKEFSMTKETRLDTEDTELTGTDIRQWQRGTSFLNLKELSKINGSVWDLQSMLMFRQRKLGTVLKNSS